MLSVTAKTKVLPKTIKLLNMFVFCAHTQCAEKHCFVLNIGTLTKKEERNMVARVTREARTTSGGISVPLRPIMGVKISNTTQMRNMK